MLSTHPRRFITVILALGLSGVGIVPAQGADEEPASIRHIAVRSASAPESAHAVIRTIPLGANGLAAGVGGQSTVTTSDDTIYVTANHRTLYRIDPITLALAGTATVGT